MVPPCWLYFSDNDDLLHLLHLNGKSRLWYVHVYFEVPGPRMDKRPSQDKVANSRGLRGHKRGPQIRDRVQVFEPSVCARGHFSVLVGHAYSVPNRSLFFLRLVLGR